MCELFAMSAGQNYSAQEYLPVFADKSRDNISGWGIGFFRGGQVVIEKSCEGIYAGDQVHDSFQRLARVVDSRIIISHIRCPNAGHQKESQAQPLSDYFLDHHWLFSYKGTAPKCLNYQSPRPILPEELLAARTFEFVRDGLETQMQDSPNLSLYQALAVTSKKLITAFPGNHIFFLANESVLFAFFNNAQILTYHPPEVRGEALVLTTVSGGLTRDPEHWHAYPNRDLSRGQILIVSGADLLYQGHL